MTHYPTTIVNNNGEQEVGVVLCRRREIVVGLVMHGEQ